MTILHRLRTMVVALLVPVILAGCSAGRGGSIPYEVKNFGRPDAPVLSPAEERLTVAEAIHANTMGAAYQLRMDDRIGSVEVGKRADLIVLDRNILAIDPHEIHRTAVVLTMMDGVVRHRA